MIIGKLKKLGTAIEMHFGDRMNIDHPEYRWVNDRIEYYESEERLLTKEEFERHLETGEYTKTWFREINGIKPLLCLEF